MGTDQPHDLSQLTNEVISLREQVAELTTLVSDLARTIRPKTDPLICAWPEVARLLGVEGGKAPARARERVRYQNSKIGSYSIRIGRGGCFRKDLLRHLEREAERRSGRGSRIRRAIRQQGV